MIPILYDKTGNTKITNLTDCIQCIVTEERNGMFEAELVYSVHSSNSDKLIRGNIIVADANDTLKEQKFRIYKVTRPINGKIKILARHISFDMARDVVTGLVIDNQSCEYALNKLFSSSQFSQHFIGHSDIVNSQSTVINGTTHILKAIVGVEGSIIDTFGTSPEILRDNYDFYIYENRGHDNGVTIEYGKNLTGLNLDTDDSNMITRIRAIAKYRDENQEEVVVVSRPEFIDSPYINNYETPFIQEIDFSDQFKDDNIPTPLGLKTLAEEYFVNNKCDLPSENATLSFIPLSKCVGYEGIQDKISLCDTVTVIDYRYNLTTKVKVIKVSYNTLKERYENMEVGEPRSRLGDIISNSMNSVKGEKGDKGEKGEPGAPGNIGDFPDALPATPILTSSLYGFASIELSWTFESQPYYTYELYASKTQNFTPNEFDLLFEGKGSTFLFQAKPNETWYFRVRAVNSYGRGTSFSNQVTVTTTKIDDLSNYVENAAIGEALIGTLSLDRGWVGTLKGNYIDAKQLSVTDGNNKRTLFIDSFGNVSLDVTELKISSKKVATSEEVEYTVAGYAKTSYVDDAMRQAVNNAKDGMVSSTDLTLNNTEILMSAASMGQYNLLRNSDFRNGLENWTRWGVTSPHTLSIVKTGGNVMNGENNACFSSLNATVGNLNIGFYQEVVLVPNSTYTLSYWTNCTNSTVRLSIISRDASDTSSTLAYKNYTDINGTKDRNTWKFDSITFVVPSDSTKIRVTFSISSCTNASYNAYLVKPMLVSGTTAQSWTGHPDEIYVGVVSITEKKGLMVEHSNANTKTVMSADGFSIEDNNGDVLAWLSSKEQWTELKADKVFAGNIENIYTGDGNLYVDHSAIVAGNGTANSPFNSFAQLKTHLEKNPVINKDIIITVRDPGFEISEQLNLERLKGTGYIAINLEGQLLIRCYAPGHPCIRLTQIPKWVWIIGSREFGTNNTGPVLCDDNGCGHGIIANDVSRLEVDCITIACGLTGIKTERTHLHTYRCDFGKCPIAVELNYLSMYYMRDDVGSCIAFVKLLTGSFAYWGCGTVRPKGAVQNDDGVFYGGTSNLIEGDSTRFPSSNPSTPPVAGNQFHTYTYNCTSKQSYQYSWSNWSTDGSCKQGAWGNLSPYVKKLA